MQSILPISLAIYLIFYVFEGFIRYGFNLIGTDSLIFIRDAVLILPLMILFIQQLLRRQIHPAFIIYMFVIVLHGVVMMANIGSSLAVVYGAKMLVTLLAGALLASTLFNPSRKMVVFVFLLWSISWAGVLLDKYYVEFPWTGLATSIGDVQVEISRDWQISGEDKRAAGFMRSSINVATVVPLLALLLIFNLRSLFLRLLVALATAPALVWTTQKGPIVAYLLTLVLLALAPKRPIALLRLGVVVMIILAIALPLILPAYAMPHTQGVFSFSSFYQRVEEMWPQAWRWIAQHDAFPFGVGLGGISGAQRMYALSEMNAADNIFILMYAYFGVMSFVYLGAVAYITMRTDAKSSKKSAHALATLFFLMAYGCVISLLEDQMASLFFGAALAWLCHEFKSSRQLPVVAA